MIAAPAHHFGTRHSENIFTRKEQICTEHVLKNIRQQRTWFRRSMFDYSEIFSSLPNEDWLHCFAETHVASDTD